MSGKGSLTPTHRIVYLSQVRVESLVEVDPSTGRVVAADPMLKLYIGSTIPEIRARKLVTKVEDLNPKPVVVPRSDRLITLTDE